MHVPCICRIATLPHLSLILAYLPNLHHKRPYALPCICPIYPPVLACSANSTRCREEEEEEEKEKEKEEEEEEEEEVVVMVSVVVVVAVVVVMAVVVVVAAVMVATMW